MKATEPILSEEQLIKVIDALGDLKAEIANLEQIEAKLKKQIIDSGVRVFEGELFRVTVSVLERETLDMEAVRNKLSPQFIEAHTSVKEVTTLRVSARKGEE